MSVGLRIALMDKSTRLDFMGRTPFLMGQVYVKYIESQMQKPGAPAVPQHLLPRLTS